MQKMVEEPSPENGDGALRQASLRPPRVLVEGGVLLLLPQALLQVFEPRRFAFGEPRFRAVFLPQLLAALRQLLGHGLPQAPEVPRHGLLRKAGVRRRRAEPHYHVE